MVNFRRGKPRQKKYRKDQVSSWKYSEIEQVAVTSFSFLWPDFSSQFDGFWPPRSFSRKKGEKFADFSIFLAFWSWPWHELPFYIIGLENTVPKQLPFYEWGYKSALCCAMILFWPVVMLWVRNLNGCPHKLSGNASSHANCEQLVLDRMFPL